MKLKKVNYLTEEKFNQLVSGEIEGKTYNPAREQYLIIDTIEDMFFRVYTTTTMNTSTLPSMAVPALTAQQVGQIQTAMSQGKVVTIDATHNGITNQMKVIESDHDGEVGGIRITYYNNYIDYTLDGTTVTATYTPIGGPSGAPKLYKHVLNSSYIRDSGASQNQRIVIYNYSDEAYTYSTLSYRLTHEGYYSAFIFPGYGFGDYTFFSSGGFSSVGMDNLVTFENEGMGDVLVITPDTEDFTDTVEEV